MNRFLEKTAATEISDQKVKTYLNKNYPADTLKWVSNAKWTEQEVPLSKIKMARRPGGAREQEKVKGIAQAFRENKKMEPIVLVKNGEGEYKIADGYHRTLGCKQSGRMTIKAWIGTTEEKKGPWDKEMHERKLNVGKAAFESFEEFEKEASLLGGVARLGGKMVKSTAKEIKNFGSGITGIGAKKAKNNLNSLKTSGTATAPELATAKKNLTGERLNQAKSFGIAGLGGAGFVGNKMMEQDDLGIPDPQQQFNQNRQLQKMAKELTGWDNPEEPVRKMFDDLWAEKTKMAEHNPRALGLLGATQKVYDAKIKKEK